VRSRAELARLLALVLLLVGVTACRSTTELGQKSEPVSEAKPTTELEPPRQASRAEVRTSAEASSSTESTKSPASEATGAPRATALPERIPAPARLIAIGDVHGDWDTTRRILLHLGAIDEAGLWSGRDLGLVFTGDLIDRGDQDREVLDNLVRLATLAKKAGGALRALSGNHEIMNVSGDMRYVSEPSLLAFAPFAGEMLGNSTVPEPLKGRVAAFRPGGLYALLLADFPLILLWGDTLFAHGGVTPSHLRYGLSRMNRELAAWMREGGPMPSVLLDEEAPHWNRDYGSLVSDPDCVALGEVLKSVGAKRLVVGHTPQKGGISAACEGRVYRIDVGMSRAYGKNPPQVLEIRGHEVKVLEVP